MDWQATALKLGESRKYFYNFQITFERKNPDLDYCVHHLYMVLEDREMIQSI